MGATKEKMLHIQERGYGESVSDFMGCHQIAHIN